MGVPNFDPPSLPFDAAGEAHAIRSRSPAQQVEIGAVSMGNPHAVLHGALGRGRARGSARARRSRRHPRFPKRVNVGFMEVVDRSHIRLRVYERGAGETLACGTGACAAVAVGRRHGRLDENVEVTCAAASCA